MLKIYSLISAVFGIFCNPHVYHYYLTIRFKSL
nr:MAG TPA: hypothetical protein [Caudoviricetes sp.]